MAKPPSGPHDHGPLRADRLPPSRYSAKFLQDLRAQNQVVAVPEDWDGDSASLPRNAVWVIYPNGDLERVGFD